MKNGFSSIRFHFQLKGWPCGPPASIFCITSFAIDSAGASEYPPTGTAGASSAFERASSTSSCSVMLEFPIYLLKGGPTSTALGYARHEQTYYRRLEFFTETL